MGKTITTYLLSDNPNGIKSVWVEGEICKCIYLTRGDLSLAKLREELNQPALYFLLGDNKEVYIGESENFNDRIIDHNKNKDFWNEVLVFIAKDGSLSKSEVQYLERLAIDKTKEVKNYELENNNTPTYPNMEENRIEIVECFFEKVIFLTSFLIFNLFEEYKTEDENYFYCKNNQGTDAKAIYEGNKTVVLADSKICKRVVKSYTGKETREELIKQNVKQNAIDEENYFLLSNNTEFKTPSAASCFCLGNSSNGWIEWKNKEGKTLHDIIRT